MSKSTGVGALLTGMAIGAAALFLSDEKNRAKVRASILQLTSDAKELGTKLKNDPNAVLSDASKKLSTASKETAVAALSKTEKAAKSARTSLTSDTKK